jgi:RNA polymerase sigma-70 factor, ECF subfamily
MHQADTPGVIASLSTAVLQPPSRSALHAEVGSLARQAANLDVSAFADLYRLYQPQVFRFVSARVSGRQEAEDLANTIFEKAFAAIGRYRPSPAQFSTWLYTIAQNAIIDYYRKRRLPQVDDPEAELFAVTDPSEGPEGSILADERRDILYQAVIRLTPEQRMVIGCRFYFNLPIHEVAQMMGKTEGAVKALQFRALDRLRRMLAPEFSRS